MFQVVSNSSDDNPDENADNSLSSNSLLVCWENGVKWPSGCAIETGFGCLTCNVHLCKMRFFVQCHA